VVILWHTQQAAACAQLLSLLGLVLHSGIQVYVEDEQTACAYEGLPTYGDGLRCSGAQCSCSGRYLFMCEQSSPGRGVFQEICVSDKKCMLLHTDCVTVLQTVIRIFLASARSIERCADR
jgi:hypothetical protein